MGLQGTLRGQRAAVPVELEVGKSISVVSDYGGFNNIPGVHGMSVNGWKQERLVAGYNARYHMEYQVTVQRDYQEGIVWIFVS